MNSNVIPFPSLPADWGHNPVFCDDCAEGTNHPIAESHGLGVWSDGRTAWVGDRELTRGERIYIGRDD